MVHGLSSSEYRLPSTLLFTACGKSLEQTVLLDKTGYDHGLVGNGAV